MIPKIDTGKLSEEDKEKLKELKEVRG